MKQIIDLASRVLFVAAVLVAAIAVLEKASNVAGYTLAFSAAYTPARLLELAAIALMFVIALQLREMKHALSDRQG